MVGQILEWNYEPGHGVPDPSLPPDPSIPVIFTKAERFWKCEICGAVFKEKLSPRDAEMARTGKI